MKLSRQILSKLIQLQKQSNLTSKEIDFLLLIARYSNELGQVQNIRQAEVCKELSICKQTFYNILYSLEQKEIIIVDYSNYNPLGWNVFILDNKFMNNQDYKKGYVKLYDFMFKKEFRGLKATEKILILYLLSKSREEKKSYFSMSEIKESLGFKNTTLIKNYIEKINQFFAIRQVKNKSYEYTSKHNSRNSKYTTNAIFHKIKTWCDKFKINYSKYALEDISRLFKIYSTKQNKLINALCNTALHYKSLEPALITYIVTNGYKNKRYKDNDRILIDWLL